MRRATLLMLFSLAANSFFLANTQLDFGQNLNGLAIVRGAKHGVHQFLYGHGQAETVRKIAVVSVYPANALSSALSKLAKVELRGQSTSARPRRRGRPCARLYPAFPTRARHRSVAAYPARRDKASERIRYAPRRKRRSLVRKRHTAANGGTGAAEGGQGRSRRRDCHAPRRFERDRAQGQGRRGSWVDGRRQAKRSKDTPRKIPAQNKRGVAWDRAYAADSA